MASKQSRKPLLDEYKKKECLTASEFIRIFKEFDKDGSMLKIVKFSSCFLVSFYARENITRYVVAK